MGGSLVAGILGGRDDTFPNIFAIHVFPKEDDQGGTSQISPCLCFEKSLVWFMPAQCIICVNLKCKNLALLLKQVPLNNFTNMPQALVRTCSYSLCLT